MEPNHAYKTCLVLGCDWNFDITKESLISQELAVASHMVEHTPRELFTTIQALTSQLEAVKAHLRARGDETTLRAVGMDADADQLKAERLEAADEPETTLFFSVGYRC